MRAAARLPLAAEPWAAVWRLRVFRWGGRYMNFPHSCRDSAGRVAPAAPGGPAATYALDGKGSVPPAVCARRSRQWRPNPPPLGAVSGGRARVYKVSGIPCVRALPVAAFALAYEALPPRARVCATSVCAPLQPLCARGTRRAPARRRGARLAPAPHALGSPHALLGAARAPAARPKDGGRGPSPHANPAPLLRRAVVAAAARLACFLTSQPAVSGYAC